MLTLYDTFSTSIQQAIFHLLVLCERWTGDTLILLLAEEKI